ncbi:Hypothetical protein EAG7_00100 (plasmid) [Klebsiella aerogenes]|uniref:Lipoprotein n=1 Tax=Yersinia pestis biovar Orientalis str. IP275 TaxID=373665 RepID=A0AAV3B9B8_YERPE|nr:Hypothetical protein EAG7_00100 [Klebsiella aerogenes]EDR32552.1 hypothetical protein YPIP275_2952 [Yersinia pestis biovar Orientalis str. IP275]CDL65014.1 hypothetical protein [Klebsiella pneumoniae IS39]
MKARLLLSCLFTLTGVFWSRGCSSQYPASSLISSAATRKPFFVAMIIISSRG